MQWTLGLWSRLCVFSIHSKEEKQMYSDPGLGTTSRGLLWGYRIKWLTGEKGINVHQFGHHLRNNAIVLEMMSLRPRTGELLIRNHPSCHLWTEPWAPPGMAWAQRVFCTATWGEVFFERFLPWPVSGIFESHLPCSAFLGMPSDIG